MNNAAPVQSEEFKVSGRQRTSVLVICFLLYMINFMDRQVLSAVLEPMKIDLGFSDTQAGILQTAFFLSMALMGIPAAYLVDRWSRRKTLSLMAIVWSVFTYLTGMGRSICHACPGRDRSKSRHDLGSLCPWRTHRRSAGWCDCGFMAKKRIKKGEFIHQFWLRRLRRSCCFWLCFSTLKGRVLPWSWFSAYLSCWASRL